MAGGVSLASVSALALDRAFANTPISYEGLVQSMWAPLGIGDRRPDLVMRFGYGAELPKSLRRAVGQVATES
jgi:hypothetical protein